MTSGLVFTYRGAQPRPTPVKLVVEAGGAHPFRKERENGGAASILNDSAGTLDHFCHSFACARSGHVTCEITSVIMRVVTQVDNELNAI